MTSDLHTDQRLVLAFDTGSPVTSVALARGGTVLAQEAVERASSADSLVALIDAVLARAGVSPRDLDALCVLRGPGSFTGLRIGLATALGLHQALGIAVAAMPTLRVLAEACDPALRTQRALPTQRPVERVVALVGALRGDWFAQSFQRRSTPPVELEAEGPPEIVSGTALASLDTAALVGFGARSLDLGSAAGMALIEPPPLASLAARLALSWTIWDPALLTDPLYLRPAPTTPPRRSSVP